MNSFSRKCSIDGRLRLHFPDAPHAEELGDRFNIIAARLPHHARTIIESQSEESQEGPHGEGNEIEIIRKRASEPLKPPPFRTWRSATWVQKIHIQFKGGRSQIDRQ